MVKLAEDRLAAGRRHLRLGDWRAAQAAFRAALEERETAEALEGLAWAAWWLDDAGTVFGARERAFRLYRSGGSAAGAARTATWLAVDELDFNGAVTVAGGWLLRARRLLDGVEPCGDHGWLDFHEGYLAHAAGDTATAGRLARRAAELGRRLDVPDLEMLGLALEGASLVACADVEAGMRCLDEATAVALEGEAAIPIAGAWTFCLLVTACTAVLDFDRAAEWCDRIAAFAERYGSRYMLAFCRAEYGAIQVWRGRWREAEALLEASIEDFVRSRPAWAAGPLAGLAELRRRQGRPADAEALLDRAGAGTRAQLCRARLALDRGELREAAERLERMLRQVPAERRLDRAPLLEPLVRAHAARGRLDPAASALTELRELVPLAGTAALRACADRAEGVVRAAAGEHERARALLEDAVDRFERSGGAFEAATTRLELAETLLALGRTAGARREAAAARERLAGLGGPEAARAERILAGGTAAPLPELSAREREVLSLVAGGLTNREIAERLVLSEHTVHRHVTNLLRKLGLPSRTAAAAHAARAGLLG